MKSLEIKMLAVSVALAGPSMLHAGTATFFTPLTQSAAVIAPMSSEEVNAPWVVPAGMTGVSLLNLRKIEAAVGQSIVRVPGLGSTAAMFDMSAFDTSGQHIFVPHETQCGAGVTRYDVATDKANVLFAGDTRGCTASDWSNDWGAFDPATFTPHKTLLLGEEWAGQGRLIEVMNPMSNPATTKIRKRELHNVPNVAHEGLRFSKNSRHLYFVDENNSGSIYRISFKKIANYSVGQTFVLKVNAYAGGASKNYNDASNSGQPRVGLATWVPMTDLDGVKLTQIDPFNNTDTGMAGRRAADELRATPYGRPEDVEVAKNAAGKEVLYFTATSENAVYSITMQSNTTADVKVFLSEAALQGSPATPKNLGFAATTGVLNSPDNLAQDANGNIYVIEDAPNDSLVGGDVWFARDTNNDGVAESMDHFMSLRVGGSESTGMIFNPRRPNEFIISVQHPTSTNKAQLPEGLGDAIWKFDISNLLNNNR